MHPCSTPATPYQWYTWRTGQETQLNNERQKEDTIIISKPSTSYQQPPVDLLAGASDVTHLALQSGIQ
jgi:hypothetical protein